MLNQPRVLNASSTKALMHFIFTIYHLKLFLKEKSKVQIQGRGKKKKSYKKKFKDGTHLSKVQGK
jgi:hypothetical protein